MARSTQLSPIKEGIETEISEDTLAGVALLGHKQDDTSELVALVFSAGGTLGDEEADAFATDVVRQVRREMARPT